MQHARTRERGFTLIELMITLVIIALLSAAALAAYADIRDDANRGKTLDAYEHAARFVEHQIKRAEIGLAQGIYADSDAAIAALLSEPVLVAALDSAGEGVNAAGNPTYVARSDSGYFQRLSEGSVGVETTLLGTGSDNLGVDIAIAHDSVFGIPSGQTYSFCDVLVNGSATSGSIVEGSCP